jgi:putative glutamine amidotransferase
MNKQEQRSLGSSLGQKRSIIGITTYRKHSRDTNRPMFGLMRDYVQAVTAGGGIPLLIPLGLDEEDLLLIIERLDGLILPGGGDIEPGYYSGNDHDTLRDIDMDRDRVEIYVAQQATKLKKPFLAICRGHQILNVALGGTMWEDLASQYPNAIKHDFFGNGRRNELPHSVDVLPDSQLATILGHESTPVNSLHHQGVRNIAPDLMATAVAPDGLVEGLEVKGHPFGIGVQWHPENLIEDDPAMLALFEALVVASQNGEVH